MEEYKTPNKEELDKVYEEIHKEEESNKREFLKAWKYFLQHIDYNSNYAKEMLRDAESKHIGFVKVQQVETYKHDKYPRNKYYTVIGSDIKRRFVRFDGGGEFHWIVWQTTGVLEDEYHGYLLLPMNDGRYWLTEYDM